LLKEHEGRKIESPDEDETELVAGNCISNVTDFEGN
jgi:hypothetical protein